MFYAQSTGREREIRWGGGGEKGTIIDAFPDLSGRHSYRFFQSFRLTCQVLAVLFAFVTG